MDEISRTKLTRLLESRMSYGDAQSADGLISGALASLDALMKYGVHLGLYPIDTQMDPEMTSILSDAHPGNRPIQEYPKWVYHDSMPAVLLDSEDDVADLAPGYHDATGNSVGTALPDPVPVAEDPSPLVPPIEPIEFPAPPAVEPAADLPEHEAAPPAPAPAPTA